MTGDAIFEAVRSIVLRVLDEKDRVDHKARYPARVDAQTGSEVDVTFDDERLGVAKDIPLAWIPGAALTLKPGTRVLVGWRGGDERYPFAEPVWDGGGGLLTATVALDASWAFETPLVSASRSLRAGHLLNGHASDAGKVTPGAAMGGGVVTNTTGGDILCGVTFVEGATPGAGTLFTLSFVHPFDAAPQVVVVSDGGTEAKVGNVTTGSVEVTTTKTLTNGNSYTIKLLIVG